jgi:hypothetical protein
MAQLRAGTLPTISGSAPTRAATVVSIGRK